MRSPNAFEPRARGAAARGRRRVWTVAWLLVASAVTAPAAVRADEKQACSVAYDETQALRLAGRLVAARQEAVACSREVCAGFIRADCAKWLGEIESSLPTVVFEVRDAAGKDTSAARVELDGKPWLEVLDGKSKPLDPGRHTLRYALAGGGSLDEIVQIREGEKNRKLHASFQQAGAAAPVGVATPLPAAGSQAPRRSVAPWVVGGVGLAGLAVGGILGGLVLGDKSVTSDPSQCNAALMKCTLAGASAEQQGRTLGPASTAAFVVGGVGVAVAAVWLVARAPAGNRGPASTVGMGPSMNPGGGGWTVRGTW